MKTSPHLDVLGVSKHHSFKSMTDKAKFGIQAFKRPPVATDEAAIKTLEKLQEAIAQIHQKNPGVLSFEELHRLGYNMIQQQRGDMLYKGVETSLILHLQSNVSVMTKKKGDDLLRQLKTFWEEYKVSSELIRDILMYMNRTYVKKNEKLPIYDRALQLFHEKVLQNNEVWPRVCGLLLYQIEKERKGEIIEKELLRPISQMLMDLGISVYTSCFENAFLNQTCGYYKSEGQENINKCTCPEYLLMVKQRLISETERINSYLVKTTLPKVLSIVQRELVETHLVTLADMETGIMNQLQNNSLENINLIYTLFSPLPQGHKLLLDYFKQFIEANGMRAINNNSNGDKTEKTNEAITFVSTLFEFKEKVDAIITFSFQKDKLYIQAVNSVFEKIIQTEPRASEYLSQYIDDGIKHSWKEKSDSDVEVILDKVMVLFRYLQDRDLFESFYKSHLSKRLLTGKAQNDEIERSLVQRLKVECGTQFTVKLEGMFKDMQLSKELANVFRTNFSPQFEFFPTILTKGSWPCEQTRVCTIPRQLQSVCSQFDEYYVSKFTGRKLTWQFNMGTAELKAVFQSENHELIVNTYQMIILLLFNNSNSYTFKTIQEKTQIQTSDLEKQLHCLSCSKNMILKCAKSRDFSADDVFEFNPQFTTRNFKVKVAQPSSSKDSEVQRKETRQKADEDRKHEIEAAIIRVMKARKVLVYNNLVSEVTKLCTARFIPSVPSIKQRIESLIEREFLARSPNNMQEFRYLA